MSETHRSGNDYGFWGYLIKPDKSASIHLEQLCLGLARIICTLEPGPSDRLTPRRLAAFYRSIGGNLDPLFLRTSESGLSFLYRTIGCYHSLEPSTNPFETPSLPCLTPEGFVKWSTVQLLLCPEEHVRYLQEAVRVYNVPRPDGGIFPKKIPTECFPDKIDAAMDAWYKQVTSQLNQDYLRRLKSSPYHSPHPSERVDGYFGQPIPRIRRPSKTSGSDSREGPYTPNSRRSSEPEAAFAQNPIEHARSPKAYARDDRRRSASANRPVRPNTGSRQRSATTGDSSKFRPSTSSSRTGDRPPVSFYRGQYPERHGHPFARSPSGSSAGESSAEDASSEDSRGQRRPRRSKPTSSFLSILPFNTPWSKRSRSHDVSDRKSRESPRRGETDMTPPLRASTETFHRPSPSVRFRQNMFENAAATSAPESAGFEKRSHSGQRSEPRYSRNPGGPGLTDAVSPVGYNLTRETSSGSGSDRRSAYEIPSRQFRKADTLHRSRTMTGVQGRKYASIEQTSSGQMPPVIPPGATQQDQRTRYSLAV